jgi:hypothetical protein
MEQRQIFINNLAIRRATEELKVTRDCDQLGRILVAAFSSNDFDAFELRLHLLPGELSESRSLQVIPGRGEEPYLRWRKPGSHFTHETASAWGLTLDLVAPNNRRRGSMTIYRLYTERDLQLDINLLTSVFPVTLADALDRALSHGVEVLPTAQEPGLMAAQAG